MVWSYHSVTAPVSFHATNKLDNWKEKLVKVSNEWIDIMCDVYY